jgi:hypothetical protein
MKKINLKVEYPRKRWEEIERKSELSTKLRLYNKFSGDIVDIETVRPITEAEIRKLRKNREARKYYHKNAVKIKAKAEENYWRKQLWDAKPLNTAFKGCNAHHISLDYVVFIPRELHQKHPHSLKNYYRMDVINTAVLEWLMSEEKSDIAALMIELLPPELLKSEAQNFFPPYRYKEK